MQSRAPAEPTVTEFESTVERCDEQTVVLTETYFYPEGGGQPADSGTIADVEVTDVQMVDGAIHHELASPPTFEVDETVQCSIDSQRRTYLRRAHTASHVLYGAARRVLEDLGYGGFDITAEKIRIDFETSTTIDDTTLVELQRLTNAVVWESRAVSWETLPADEALSRDDIAFNTKTEEGIEGETVRIVDIEDWDVAACGGTHVENTSKIGPVTVLDRSNPGEGLTRVEFAVGPSAIQQRAREAVSARKAARALDTTVSELPSAINTLRRKEKALTDRIDDLRTQVIEARLSDLRDATVTRDGSEWLAGTVPTDDANSLGDFAQQLADQAADVVALVSETGEYVAVATTGEIDATAIVTDLTDEFGGGGGGDDSLAQAGGLDAAPEELVSYLREA